MTHRRRLKSLGALVIACAGFGAVASPAGAKTYTANALGDHAPNGCTHSDCTLREAVNAANAHAGLDTIVLRGGRTYKLSRLNVSGEEDANATGDLDIRNLVLITSSSKKRALVDAQGIDRVFQSQAVDMTFKNLVIRGGDAAPGPDPYGGGIDAELGIDRLTKLINCKVVGNRAVYGGGIDAVGGKLVLKHTTVAGNRAYDGYGGGIYDDGIGGVSQYEVVNLSRSKLIGNSASLGTGGMESYDATTIKNSTIANNHADSAFGGGFVHGDGPLLVTGSTISGNTAATNAGGIQLETPATFINDTIAKNRAGQFGGGIYFSTGEPVTATMNAVTIARNHAGSNGGGFDLENGAAMQFANSLIGLNAAGPGAAGPDCFTTSGDVSSGGHNLVGDPSGTQDCALSWSAPGDVINVNPKIAQLADNGGPTKTIALKKGSKAINHAGSDAPGRDQRGVKRHNPDIGAFERK